MNEHPQFTAEEIMNASDIKPSRVKLFLHYMEYKHGMLEKDGDKYKPKYRFNEN